MSSSVLDGRGLHGVGHAAAALKLMHEDNASGAISSVESADLCKLQSRLVLHGLAAGSQQVQLSAQLAHHRHRALCVVQGQHGRGERCLQECAPAQNTKAQIER